MGPMGIAESPGRLRKYIWPPGNFRVTLGRKKDVLGQGAGK